jgi:hypothetical protein
VVLIIIKLIQFIIRVKRDTSLINILTKIIRLREISKIIIRYSRL